MNKINSIILLSTSLLIIGACKNKNVDKESVSNDNETEITIETSDIKEKHSSIFKNGKFESNAYDLSIDKAELKHNNLSNYDTLVITFTVNNKLNENIIPKEIFQNLFFIKQKDETSEYQLHSEFAYQQEASELLFPLYDQNGNLVDDETYDINEKKQNEFKQTIGNKLEAELLPGKKVQTVILVNVENSEYPITFSLDENLPMKEKENYIINLK